MVQRNSIIGVAGINPIPKTYSNGYRKQIPGAEIQTERVIAKAKGISNRVFRQGHPENSNESMVTLNTEKQVPEQEL